MHPNFLLSQIPEAGQETQRLSWLTYAALLGQTHLVLSSLKIYEGGQDLHDFLIGSHTAGAEQTTHSPAALIKGAVAGHTHVLFSAIRMKLSGHPRHSLRVSLYQEFRGQVLHSLSAASQKLGLTQAMHFFSFVR